MSSSVTLSWTPLDPIILPSSVVLLGLVGLGGCAGPARLGVTNRSGSGAAQTRGNAGAVPAENANAQRDCDGGCSAESGCGCRGCGGGGRSGGLARDVPLDRQIRHQECNVESATLLARSADGLRFESLDECRLFLPATAFVVRRLEHLQSMLPGSEGDFAAWQRAAASPEREEEIRILADAGARFLVPIRSGLKLTGLLVLGAAKGLPPAPRPLQSLAAQLGLLLENRSWRNERQRRSFCGRK